MELNGHAAYLLKVSICGLFTTAGWSRQWPMLGCISEQLWEKSITGNQLLRIHLWVSPCILGNSGRVNALSAHPGFQKYTHTLNNAKTFYHFGFIKAWNKCMGQVKNQCHNLIHPFQELYWLTPFFRAKSIHGLCLNTFSFVLISFASF